MAMMYQIDFVIVVVKYPGPIHMLLLVKTNLYLEM